MTALNRLEADAQWADGGCEECAGENVVWFTDDVFWNDIVRQVTGRDMVLCVHCFVKRAEKRYRVTGWRLIPEFEWTPS